MKQYLIISFFLFVSINTYGQRKANNLFKEELFGDAIPYFEKLVQKEPTTKYQAKLATCYRKTNQLLKAKALYSTIVQKKRFNSRILYYYGEVLMGLGEYDAAKTWFLMYAEENPKDERGASKAAACDYVKTIQPYYEKVSFIPVPFNSEADDSNPTYFNGKIYFSSDRKVGFNVLKKKSGRTGRDFTKIYQLDWLDSNQFSAPTALPFRINSLNKNTGKPSFSRKGDVYFTRNTNTASKDGTYKLHIFHTKMSNGQWKKPEELSFCQLSINYLHPAISADGRTLYFATNRKGGEGGMDIFMSEKIGSSWSKPIPLGIPINTAEHEAFPFIHPSGKLFFSSKGHSGFGGFDVFVTEKNEKGQWHKPINIGSPINSSGDDIGFFVDSTMQFALLSSTRGGSHDDIYLCQLNGSQMITNKSNTEEKDSNSQAAIPVDLEEKNTLDDGVMNSEDEPNEVYGSNIDSLKNQYRQEFERYDIELFANDTIYLKAPSYQTDQFDVPTYLKGQLDQLIPAMYLTENLNFTVYSFADEQVEIFSEETIVYKRAEAIKAYLASKYIEESRIEVVGLSTKYSKKLPIFADKDHVIILVNTMNQ